MTSSWHAEKQRRPPERPARPARPRSTLLNPTRIVFLSLPLPDTARSNAIRAPSLSKCFLSCRMRVPLFFRASWSPPRWRPCVRVWYQGGLRALSVRSRCVSHSVSWMGRMESPGAVSAVSQSVLCGRFLYRSKLYLPSFDVCRYVEEICETIPMLSSNH